MNKNLFVKSGAFIGAAALLLLVMIFAQPVPRLQAEEIPCTENALRAAITADTIDSIDFPEDCTIRLMSDLPALTKAFIINGGGAVIDGGGEHRAFRVDLGGALTLENLTIQNNSGRLGGAVYVNGGELLISGATFRDNNAFSAFGGGAILINAGTVEITSSAFVENNSTDLGGAISIFGGEVTISNSTFMGNLAHGGGAINVSGGDVTISTTTITGNNAENGGGILKARFGNLTLGQSIVAANGAEYGNDINYAAGLTSDGYNLFGSTDFVAPFEFAATDLLDDSPELGAFNGTLYSLLPNSLAVDAVPEADCAAETDQRGGERPQGAGCDIGAVEMEQTNETVEIDGVDYSELVGIEAPAEGDCNLLNSAGLRSFEAPTDTYCRVLMRNGGWVNNPGSVPQSVIDRGVMLAIEIFSLEGGQSLREFDNALPICFRGEGHVVFLDASTSPREEIELPSAVSEHATCAFVPSPGTVALVQR
jgi:hypothetical protein